MVAISLVLLIAAFILFLLAAFAFNMGRIQPVALGLALWVLSMLITQIKW